MPSYTIRTARTSDLDAVYAIFSQVDTLHRNEHPEVFREVETPAEIKDFFLLAIQSDDAVVFVADLSEKVIGAVLAWARQTADIPLLVPKIYMSVDNLIVDEEFRGQGVGKALMEKVYAWAQARGIQEVQLTVWDFNQGALAFYEKLGYQMLHHRMRKELP